MVIQAAWFTRLMSVVIDVYAVALFPFIITAGPLSSVGEQHERIHLRQQLELGIVFFYLLYGLSFLLNRLAGMSGPEAYMSIWFEKEAYANQEVPSYLESRPLWAWVRYVSG